jgi:hypothetical protein
MCDVNYIIATILHPVANNWTQTASKQDLGLFYYLHSI